VTLARQTFRFVDHVEFAKPAIIEQFLQPWRRTGQQRFGYLYGRYEPYSNVPLGIKAVVEAIYLPFQKGDGDWVEPLNVLEGVQGVSEQVAGAAKSLGLEQVGMIWTDLVDDGQGQGKVLAKRHAASWFLSGQEAIFCAKMQSMRRRSDGFGSRFITCIITGNGQGEVDIAAYQVSNEAEAMVEADLVAASVNPNLLRVQQESPTRYVPEVFYTLINDYKLKERKAARPTFPVEYWLVNVSHGFPSVPNPTFQAPQGLDVEDTTVTASDDVMRIKRHLRTIGFTDQSPWTLIADFGLYVSIARTNLLSQQECDMLAQVVTNRQPELWDRLVRSPGWQTLFAVLDMSTAPPNKVTAAQPRTWACRHCTFENTGNNDSCDVCGLPQQ
jgi:nuclear protein localization family protein 4